MSSKLGPHQLQIIAGYAERIDDPAVPAGKTGAPFDCSAQPLQLPGKYLAHGPALDDQIDFLHEGLIFISFKSVFYPDPEATGFQEGKDRKSTRLNSSHVANSYAVFSLKKKKLTQK